MHLISQFIVLALTIVPAPTARPTHAPSADAPVLEPAIVRDVNVSRHMVAAHRLAAFGVSLGDATLPFLVTVEAGRREAIEAALRELSTRLIGGRIADVRVSLASAQALIAALDSVTIVEVGAVSLALELIERAIATPEVV